MPCLKTSLESEAPMVVSLEDKYHDLQNGQVCNSEGDVMM